MKQLGQGLTCGMMGFGHSCFSYYSSRQFSVTLKFEKALNSVEEATEDFTKMFVYSHHSAFRITELFFFFFNFYFIFKLYNIVLVLPYIEMNPPQAYMCSPSWTLLPLPSPYHPSGSSQCTSPKHPVLCIKSGLVTHFIYDIIHISMPFSQIIPPSPSPTESWLGEFWALLY